MLLKTINLKFINNLKYTLAFSLALVFCNGIVEQEIIDETKEAEKTEDTVRQTGPRKIDGVAAVVGDYVILDSDIDKTILQLQAQGVSTEGLSRCSLFGKLLEDKLYAHHAIQDSVEVSDAEIRANVDYQIEQFIAQSGKSIDELLAFYRKDDEKSFRDEMYEINKSNKLASAMQKKIIDDIEVTPEEVRIFFNKIPEDQRPEFGTELKVSQIVIEPKVAEADNQRAIARLKEFKQDIEENGASFSSKAVLYSDDPGSRSKGGKLPTLNRKNPQMIKEFRDVAFSLQEGEISDPFKTDYGYHIVYLEKIRGQEYDVKHILLIPKVTDVAIKEAKEELELIRKRITDGEISFEEAAREFSDEKETRSEGGRLINPATQDYNFELTKMDPELYGQIQSLKDNEISLVLSEQGRTGGLKFKIITVSDRIDEHIADYARDYLKIKELAVNEKRYNAVEKWQTEKIKDTYIKINGEYRDCEFSSNWLKK